MDNIIANRYSLLHKLGEGGMADVYLAIDTILNREVAVKILRGDMAVDPVAVLRFKREATAALTLNHPNIVEVYDVGEENGQHYIVMEYIKGITLKQLISKRGALDKQESVDIMRQLVGAMIHAHKNNVVHRDIKPQNILIKDDGTVKLSDFGIALAQNAAQLTQADSVLGSVHYLAPELARGEAASDQSDIYALGIVFYELLSGDVPFKGDAPIQIAMKHMRDDFPSVRDFNPTIPQSIENIILIATAKNKNNRYRSCSAMFKDLETCLDAKRANEEKVRFDVQENLDEKTHVFITKYEGDINDDSKSKSHNTIVLERMLGISLTIFAIVAMFGIMILTGLGPFKQEINMVTIPNIAGLNEELAGMKLRSEGLVVEATRREWSVDYEAGYAVGVKEGIGNSVEEGSGVTLVISEGKYYSVDDFVGKTIDEARAICSEYGIKVNILKEYTSEAEPGIVLAQNGLKAGSLIKPTTYNEIRFTVAYASEFIVPNVLGWDIYEAETYLKDAGFTVKKFKVSPDDDVTYVQNEDEVQNEENNVEDELEGPSVDSTIYGVVIQQNPSAETPLSATGSLEVELYYY